MKLDATDLRYVTSEEFRVLTAVEMGSKNHEVVPTSLISQIAGLRGGGTNKLLGSLAKRNLVSRVQNSKYDGYRLTYGGYDYLSMRALSKRESMYSVGNQIGVGKESDIYIVADAEGSAMVLKLHRLGRVSFRAIKEKRDYMGKRKSASWMYMSRLAAQKEWAFMKVLHEHDFPVPRPIDQTRHCILMEFIDAYPLRQIADIPSPGKLYSQLMDIIVRFAHAGLIHGDYNEFNILIRRETSEPIVIDFPQMVSTSHENAEWYFNRDVECIRRFFRRRFRYESVLYPRFKSTMKQGEEKGDSFQLDVVVAASGFSKKEMKTLEEFMESVREETEDGVEDEDMEQKGSDENEDNNEEFEDESESSDEGVEDEAEAKIDVDDGVEVFSTTRMVGRGQGSASKSSAEPDAGEEPSGAESSSSSRRSRAPSPTDSLVAHAASLSLNDTLDKASHVGDTRIDEEADAAGGGGLSGDLNLNGHADVSGHAPSSASIQERVASEVVQQRARQAGKYHAKRGARKAGRPKGSKAKQDTRVRMDRSGVWE